MSSGLSESESKESNEWDLGILASWEMNLCLSSSLFKDKENKENNNDREQIFD